MAVFSFVLALHRMQPMGGTCMPLAAVFFVLSWSGFVFQLAGMRSRVPWPIRDFNGGGHLFRWVEELKRPITRLRKPPGVWSTVCQWVQSRSRDPHLNCMGIHAHLAVSSMVLGPFRKDALGGL